MTQYDRYIKDVQSGKQLSCEYVKLAIQRHLNDLERSDIYFDREEADKAIVFFKSLRHTAGEYQDKLFQLLDWQAFVVAMVYGWRRKDGRRRFRKIYTEIARKNGKSELLGAAALKALIADGEKGSQVYTAATKSEQARIVFTAAKYMGIKLRTESKKVHNLLEIQTRRMNVIKNNSFFEILSSESDKLDGLNTSFAAIDEYGAHKNNELLKVIETSMGSRLQPLLWIITTAYFDKEAPCYHFRDVCIKVLRNQLTDDSLFPIIFTLDDGDDWKDKNVWIKANPSIGITPYWEAMEDAFTRALNEGQVAEIQFKTKHLNIWTTTGSTWIPDDVYQEAYEDFTEEDLLGEECYGALDLATERDIAAYCLWFPKSKRFLHYYYCPEQKIQDRKQGDGVDYRQWESDGHIEATAGDWIDFKAIKEEVMLSVIKFKVREIEYDPWGAAVIVQQLIEEGVTMFPFRQGYKSMSPPAKELNSMFHHRQIKHNGNPVTRWMFSNVTITYDPTMAIKIDKSKSSDKVDGVVALVMAIGGWLENRDDEEVQGEVVYKL